MEDYIKYLADKYDLSVSETTRTEIRIAVNSQVSFFYPDFKLDVSNEEFLEASRSHSGEGFEREAIHRLLSKVYFETRKAVEYRLSRELPAENKYK